MNTAVRCYTQTGDTKKPAAADTGGKLREKEFRCRGKFTALHAGHFDAEDLKAVRDFTREVIA